ncbi:OsmC family protein [Neorhodopirellula pilleata]|uniref:OsmC-like protein n=1 Tax=Neorhodopirellula pilleata TaxID=2714738 RepID=A0A5C5ZQA0_9BACT|nr:OsmC family protein [Neorhodopirellula pilleata]TWT89376.1 OsmC-like protein [Neorhodopirellula pilleata]
MSVELTALYNGKLHCTATHGPSGKTLTTDAPVDNGGSGSAFSPTDLVATALGTCVLTILGLVAQRHELDLAGTTVHVTKEMVQTPIRRIGSLVTTVTFPSGLRLDAAMRARLQAAAEHCPVHQSLHPDIHAPIELVGGE